MAIRVKRAYDSPAPGDGARYLVDRLWPRGVPKEALRIEGWLKDLGPSDGLRRWFRHDPARWREFRRRYFLELREKKDLCRELALRARRGTVTLLYGARDPRHNQAVALKTFLERRVRSAGRKK